MIFFVYLWLRWGVVISQALRYRPFTGKCDKPVDVIIPVVDEPADLFRKVLYSITAQSTPPARVIVVINGPRNRVLERVAAKFPTVHTVWTRTPGKRNAIRVGVKHVKAKLTVLVDIDTIWTKTTLRELTKPFTDRRVGGVTTRQKILDDDRNLITLFCSMMEEIRAEGTMKAMSVHGAVGCLPGRTIAFRTGILRASMEEFMTERFMGFHKEVSDDRSLTNLTL